ncbi:hypothetical protein AB0958_03415 [Streptomyces sp. NPDC006655]|uniref:hypothetical protein n=1 Tax=Streptomyces sp. NPDC006655 TaxID=3156898 RepID=UPI00345148DA
MSPSQAVSHSRGVRDEQWREWLRRSRVGVDLVAWWDDGDIRGRVGDTPYPERLVDLLSRATPRDCAAMGLGCSRRIDRPCREPETCGQDPIGMSAAGAAADREGPVPGACSHFVDCWSPLALRVEFSADDRHRAVHMSNPNRWGEFGVWVDGVPLRVDAWLDQSGYWVGDRFYVLQAAGPEDHPDQQIALGLLGYRILSLVIHDARHSTTRLFVPDPSETWTNPLVRLEGDQLLLYADEVAVSDDHPDRSVPAESSLP